MQCPPLEIICTRATAGSHASMCVQMRRTSTTMVWTLPCRSRTLLGMTWMCDVMKLWRERFSSSCLATAGYVR